MRQVMQLAMVSLFLTGLGFAADRSSQSEGAPGDMNRGGVDTRDDRSGQYGSDSYSPSTGTRGGSIAPGGSGATESGMGSRSAVGSTQMQGTVESVDQSGNRVRVRDSQGNIREYTVSDDTKFMNNQKKSKFSDVKAGDTVTFELDSDNESIQKFETGQRKK